MSSIALPKVSVPPLLIGYGLAAIAAAGLVVWLASGGARKAGEAVGSIPGELAAGTVLGIGDSIGVPRTHLSECDRAIRDGRLWDASFACPAGTFIRGIFGSPGDEAAKPIDRSADSSGVSFYPYP